MTKTETAYGTLIVGELEDLFLESIARVEKYRVEKQLSTLTWALTGGSTPKAFYRYCVENKAIPNTLIEATRWYTSDERHVPLSSDESNFGNADRLLLRPLGIPEERKFPWPTDHEPKEAAHLFNGFWNNKRSSFSCFDICFLGMGDDCHTASIFPHSPLLREPVKENFADVEVPGKGHRLTITPYGLTRCGMVVIMVTGEAKAVPLRNVLEGVSNPEERPSQYLKNLKEKVLWLVDPAAAGKLQT